MDFKNLSENLIIIIVVAIVSGYVGYRASTEANKQTVELLKPTIEEAIRKETTSISNAFSTEIKKLKTTKDGTVTLVVSPDVESFILKPDSVRIDTVEKTKRKKWFQFWK